MGHEFSNINYGGANKQNLLYVSLRTFAAMIHECIRPMPCTTPLGDGYIWYIKANGMFENDEYTVVLCHDGSVRHFNSSQVNVWYNATYDISKPKTIQEFLKEEPFNE